MFPKWPFPVVWGPTLQSISCRLLLWDGEMLTLRESVGLHDIQKSLHQVEQDPYRPRFVMGHCLVNSRRYITEIQLSRRWESPRLRLQLEFSGRYKRPQQQDDPGLPHRAHVKPRLDVKLGLYRSAKEVYEGDYDWISYRPYQKGEGDARWRGERNCKKSWKG